MTYPKNLQVPYHQQDTDYYCGAASAQMVLDSIGAGLLDQDDLFSDNQAHSHYDLDSLGKTIWSTPPDGLAWTLNNRKPQQAASMYFCEYPLDFYPPTNTQDAVSRKIAWTIEHYGVAPVALVLGASHWIVIRGMDLSQAPTGSSDTSYIINNFRVNDPWPPVPAWSDVTHSLDPALCPPPPHSSTDNCGTGNQRGIADQLMTYGYWLNTYMTGADYASYWPNGHWQGLFVAICDPEPPARKPGPVCPPRRYFKGERLLKHSQVLTHTSTLLKEQNFPKEKRWEALTNATPSQPLLVQRLDRRDDFYYIVPLLKKEDAAHSALTVNARFGEFQQAILFPEPEMSIVKSPVQDVIHEKILNKKIYLDNMRGAVTFRKETTVIPDYWFWKPCLESLSPYWPFTLVMSGNNKVYVRIDGQVFTTLHENVLGI